MKPNMVPSSPLSSITDLRSCATECLQGPKPPAHLRRVPFIPHTPPMQALAMQLYRPDANKPQPPTYPPQSGADPEVALTLALVFPKSSKHRLFLSFATSHHSRILASS